MIRVKREITETYTFPQKAFMRRLGLGSPIWYVGVKVVKCAEWDDDEKQVVTVVEVRRTRRQQRPDHANGRKRR